MSTRSVYVDAPGVVVPAFTAAVIENKQGLAGVNGGPGFTQLPPGAPRPASGPRLLNPTFVPAWRMPVTPSTPVQLAGAATAWPSLPTEATINTPRAVISLTAC